MQINILTHTHIYIYIILGSYVYDSTTPKLVNVSKPYSHHMFVWCFGWFIYFSGPVGSAVVERDTYVGK